MRLTPGEVAAIKSAAREAFGDGVVVRLFGSRVRDDLHGGDIDLLLEVDAGQDTTALQARFLDRLFRRIDERKVDLLFHQRGAEMPAFVRHVLPGSIVLA